MDGRAARARGDRERALSASTKNKDENKEHGSHSSLPARLLVRMAFLDVAEGILQSVPVPAVRVMYDLYGTLPPLRAKTSERYEKIADSATAFTGMVLRRRSAALLTRTRLGKDMTERTPHRP